MKLNRLIAALLTVCMLFSAFIVNASAEEHQNAVATGGHNNNSNININGIAIDESTDLAALGLDGAVEFIDREETDEDFNDEEPDSGASSSFDAYAPSVSHSNMPDAGETPSAIVTDGPTVQPKAVVKHFGDVIDADLGFGTENNINATTESNITEDRTYYIWGSCRVDYTINVYPGRTLTFYIKKRRVISKDDYGGQAVARLTRGSDMASGAPMFRVYRGAKLYIYGHGDSTVVDSYNEYYHLQITNGSKSVSASIVDFVNETNAGGSSSTENATFVCERVTFRNTKKSGPGGAIVVNAPVARFDMKWCGFRNLDATYGGGIHISDACTARIANLVLQGCKFNDCNATSGSGGGIYIEKGAYKETNSDGEIVYKNDRIKFTKFDLSGTSFTSCTSYVSGGAIAISGASKHNEDNAGLLGTSFGRKDDNGNPEGGLILDDCTFTSCKAGKIDSDGTVHKGNGGALIFEARATLISVDNATFNNCEATCGGSAIYLGEGAVVNSFVATGTTFSNNKGCTGNINYGGTFRTVGLASVNAVLTNCTFNNNTSQDGAGIYWNSGRVYNGSTFIVSAPSLTLDGCIIRNNTASRNGGGIYNESKLIITNTNIYSNNALEGAGISVRNYSNEGGQLPSNLSLNLDSTTKIYSNTATQDGGGLCFELRDTRMEAQAPSGGVELKLILTGAQVYGNTATANGGGVCFKGSANADEFYAFDIELISGSIYSNSAVNGGGIYASSVSHTIHIRINGGVIGGSGSANTASGKGGGVYIATDKVSLNMTNGDITYNVATSNGGGIYSDGSTAEFTGGTICYNQASSGGGVYVHNGGHVEMGPTIASDGTVTGYSDISHNITSGSGGGLYLHGASTAKITEVIMSYNVAGGAGGSTGNGGGVAIANGVLTVEGGQFLGNVALSGNGGGIMAQGSTSSVTIIGGVIGSENDILLANQAARGGGVAIQNNATLNISDGIIGYNKAIVSYDANNVAVADSGVGGGVYTANSNSTINGGNIIGNQAANKGGGVYVYSANESNTMTISGGTIGVDAEGTPAPNIANYGGGVYINNAKFAMTKNGDVSGSITHNVAVVDGGGLYVALAPVTIAGDISDNIAARNGGGVYLENAAISLTGNISDNKAGYSLLASGETPVEGQGNGGGIYVASDYTDNASVDEAAINGTISGNYANLNGGGVYARGGTIVTISGGDIHSNNATNGNGGGVFATDADTFVKVVGGNVGVEDMPNIALNGGGVYIDGADFILDKSANSSGSISYNLALSDGGGGYFYNTTVQINGNISENAAQGSGGGIYLNNAVVTVAGDILDNRSISLQGLRSTAGNGGGACLVDGSELNMGADGQIVGNTTDGNGGGIAAYTDSTVNLGGGFITDNTAAYGFGGGVYANDSIVNITGSDISYNSAKNGGGVCVTLGGNLIMLGGLLRYNTAVGTPDSSIKTAFHLDDTLAGVGGGVYLSNGVEAELSTYELTGIDDKFGIYGNLADFAADDVFANGVNTQLTLPRALSMTLTGTEFERATGWFEDYAKGDSNYADGLNGNPAIGGVRYKTADRTVIAYVSEADAADKATDSMLYINTTNTYVCLTLGVAKAGYGEITIMKSGESIDPDQLFVFTVSGISTETRQYVEFSVTIKGAGSITIVDVPDGEYTITEVTDWSWRYTLANIVVSNGSVDIPNLRGTVIVGASDASPDIEFFNSLVKDSWLDGNSTVAKNVAGTPNQLPEATASYPITVDLPRKEELA